MILSTEGGRYGPGEGVWPHGIQGGRVSGGIPPREER